MPTPNGYSSQKMRGPARHQTVQTLGSDRVGIPTAQMYLFEKTPVAYQVVSVVKVIDKAGKPELNRIRVEFDGAHDAKKFDIIRMLDGVLESWEFEVVSVLSSTILEIYNNGDLEGVEQLPEVGDQAKTLRWITAQSDSSGALTTTPGPLQIKVDGVTTQVSKDTAVPANTVAVPVEIIGLGGNPINIHTDGDVDMHISSEGVNFDSTRIGNGSGNYAGVNASSELKTHDADALTQLALLSTAAKQDLAKAVLDNILTALGLTNGYVDGIEGALTTLNAKDFATTAKQDLAKAVLDNILTAIGLTNGYVDGIEGALTTLNAKDFATSAKQDTLATAVGLLSKLTDTQPVSLASLPAPAVPAALTLKQARVSLPTAGTAVRATTDGAAVSSTRRMFRLYIDPDDVANSAKFYVGPSTVTHNGATTKGEQIFPGAPFCRDNDVNEFYIVSDVSTQFFTVTEEE